MEDVAHQMNGDGTEKHKGICIQGTGSRVYSKIKEIIFFQLRRNKLVPGGLLTVRQLSFLRKSVGSVWEGKVLTEQLCSKPVTYLWDIVSPDAISADTRILKMYAFLLTDSGKNINHTSVMNIDTSLESSYELLWLKWEMYPVGSHLNVCPQMVTLFVEVVEPLVEVDHWEWALGYSQDPYIHPKLSLCSLEH